MALSLPSHGQHDWDTQLNSLLSDHEDRISANVSALIGKETPAGAQAKADAARTAAVAKLVTHVDEQAGATYTDKLIAANAAAAALGSAVHLGVGGTLTSTIDVPTGVSYRTHGRDKTILTYAGAGTALRWTGAAATDSRRAGGCDPLAVKLTGGGTAIELIDCRDLDIKVAVLGNGGVGTTISGTSVGVRVAYSTINVGSSWNHVHLYAEYCNIGLDLDGTAHTPTWVTRNEFKGHIQSCNTAVRMNGANTNSLRVHPQNCTTGFSLTNSDTNDFYTVCENNTQDINADSASQNNRFRGSFDTSSVTPSAFGTNPSLLNTQWTSLPAYRSPYEWDGNGANFLIRPKSAQSGTTHWAVWTRNDTDTLSRAFYVERGVASPKTQFDGPVKFNGAVDLSASTVTQPTGGVVRALCVAGVWQPRPTASTNVTCLFISPALADGAPPDFITGVDLLFQPTS